MAARLDSWATGLVAVSAALGEPAPWVDEEHEAEIAPLRATEKVTRARAVAEVVAALFKEIERAEVQWRW